MHFSLKSFSSLPLDPELQITSGLCSSMCFGRFYLISQGRGNKNNSNTTHPHARSRTCTRTYAHMRTQFPKFVLFPHIPPVKMFADTLPALSIEAHF